MQSDEIQKQMEKLRNANAYLYPALASALVDGWNMVQLEIKKNSRWNGDAQKAHHDLKSIGFLITPEQLMPFVKKDNGLNIILSKRPQIKSTTQDSILKDRVYQLNALYGLPEQGKDLHELLSTLLKKVRDTSLSWSAVDLSNPIQSVAYLYSIQKSDGWFYPVTLGLEETLLKIPIHPRVALPDCRNEWIIDAWRARYYAAVLRDPLSHVKNNETSAWLLRGDNLSDFYRSCSSTCRTIGWKVSEFSFKLEEHLNGLKNILNMASSYYEPTQMSASNTKTEIQALELPTGFVASLRDGLNIDYWSGPEKTANLFAVLIHQTKEVNQILKAHGITPPKGQLMESLQREYPTHESMIIAAARDDFDHVLSIIRQGDSLWINQIIEHNGLVFDGLSNHQQGVGLGSSESEYDTNEELSYDSPIEPSPSRRR